ncbi:MAG: tetratricopeptide repeat protein [Verrucomicrobia bacterium]|nr:tetratricopeptide repeat protein [Verrucomicrobiota bacterium]
MSGQARPEIFVSATSKDLKSCRQLVSDALLTLGCVPITQDHFAPDAHTVREMLRAKIAACDAVIHLAGECYGAEPHEHDPSTPRRSYTQLEYDIARELKKTLYTFLCAPDFPYDAHEPEPDDLRALQQQHREELTTGDHLYLPIKNSQELNLRVRELQTRVESLSKDLQKTRSWLGRGVAAALVALALIGGVLFLLHQRGQRTEQRAAQAEQKALQVSDELDRYRQAVHALAERYGKDVEPGRRLSEQEKFDRALAAVAEQQKISVPELQAWMEIFVTQVRANPGADFYDRALADFAEKHFADAAANATKSAEQFRTQREAAEKVAAAAGERAGQAREKERRAWSLAADAEFAAGHFAASSAPYQQALALYDEAKEPLPWCAAAQNLQRALWRGGRYPESEALARRLVGKHTALQGADHPDTLESMNSLAILLFEKGNYAEAEQLQRHCLTVRERTLGAENPATLQSLNGLALVLKDKGDLAGAEELSRRCLVVRERVLGKDHLDTLFSVANLAVILQDEDKLAEAEPLERRCAEGLERTVGSEHPFTLQTLSNLANLLRDKGDLDGAEPIYRRVLAGQENALGREHIATLVTLDNFAQLLAAKGNLNEAEALYLRGQAGMEHTLPPEHPLRLDLDSAFSLLRQKQGRLDEALALAEHAAAGARQSMAENNPRRLHYEQQVQELRAQIAAAGGKKNG